MHIIYWKKLLILAKPFFFFFWHILNFSVTPIESTIFIYISSEEFYSQELSSRPPELLTIIDIHCMWLCREHIGVAVLS